jgi:MoxR-like ATPase
MPQADDADLQSLIAKGVNGLTPELLVMLPRPLSAPRFGVEGSSASSAADELEAVRKEVLHDRELESEAQRSKRERALKEAQSYLISDELLHALHVALLLRQPLLLTGDPGVGKTRFARALAGRLQIPVERIDVKTTTTGRDMLYAIDDIARFRDAAVQRRQNGDDKDSESKESKTLKDYITFSGLGRAILRAAGPDYRVTPKVPMEEVAGRHYTGHTSISLGELFPDIFTPMDRLVRSRSHSVVLIDELDKAPRDTPNDLLVEIEEMVMYIGELGFRVEAAPHFWPIVVITSNSERSLPDPFLRRCVFHNLKLDAAMLPRIVAAQLPDLPRDSPLVQQMIAFFLDIRTQNLDKTPSTAELIGTIALLVELGFDPQKRIDFSDTRFKAACEQVAAALGKVTTDKEKVVKRLAAPTKK